MKKELAELKNMELVTNGYQIFKVYKKDYIDYAYYDYCLTDRILTNDKSANNTIDNIVISDIMSDNLVYLYQLHCNGYKFSELNSIDELQSVIFDNVENAKNELMEQGYLLKIFKGGIFYLTEDDSFSDEIIENAYKFIHNDFNIVDKITLSDNKLFIKDETSVKESIIFNAKKVNAYNAMSILLQGHKNISLSMVYNLINSGMVDVLTMVYDSIKPGKVNRVKDKHSIYISIGNMVEYYTIFELNTKTLNFDKVELNTNAIELLYANSERLNDDIAINAIRKELSNAIIPVLQKKTIKKANKVVRLDNIMINHSPFYLLSNDSIQLFISDNKMINVIPYNDSYLICFK